MNQLSKYSKKNRKTRENRFSEYKNRNRILVNMEKTLQLDQKTFQKIMFIHNAIEKGWSVKKTGESYVFSKKHENKQEVFSKDYLENFIESNIYQFS